MWEIHLHQFKTKIVLHHSVIFLYDSYFNISSYLMFQSFDHARQIQCKLKIFNYLFYVRKNTSNCSI